jgi:DNA polymerase elongation subunit (family B)
MYFYTNVHLHKGKLLVRGYDNGARFKEEFKCRPYLFVPSNTEDTEYKTLQGRSVKKISFNTPSEAREFTTRYDGVDGFDIYGMTNHVYPFINDHFPKTIEYDVSKISVVNIDIEVAADAGFPDIKKADKEVTAITMSKNNKFYVFGCGEFVNNTPDRVIYVKCANEKDLLRKFLMAWNAPFLIPDVVTGWNVEFFDIPYLVNRITNVLSAEEARTLSPWRILETRKLEIKGKEQEVFLPIGITVLDYLQLYKKFSYTPQESYKLDHIAEYELKVKKIDYSEYGSLLELYKENYQKFIEYNIRDVELVDKLDAKMGFIGQVFSMAYDAKISYSDTLTTVRMWDVIIHNYLMNRNIVVPAINVQESDETFDGGYVKEVRIGMSKWVVSFDLNSLYPHLIMQYNIGPETIRHHIDGISVDGILDGGLSLKVREYLVENNLTISASGHTFDRSKQGFLAELMQTKYNSRVDWNNEKKLAQQQLEALGSGDSEEHTRLKNRVSKCHNMQMALKIQLNSAYGALGNKYFRWYDLRNAESITTSGKLSIRWMDREINAYLNTILKTDGVDYVIASDTDSLYLTLDSVVAKTGLTDTQKIVDMLDRFCNDNIQTVINEGYQHLADHMNAYAQKMFMKREAIADRGIWTKKKHYILNVYDMEGKRKKEPELKIVGMEAIKSSTPAICRVAIKDCFKIIMQKTESDLISYVSDFKSKFFDSKFEEIAFPRGVNNLSKYSDKNTVFKKGTPLNVRCSLMYNHMIKKLNLEDKYPTVAEKDKIKYTYLHMPNPSGTNAIACPGELPPEFNLDAYINYDVQFNKSFIEPLDVVLKVIGWEYEKKFTIDRFYE